MKFRASAIVLGITLFGCMHAHPTVRRDTTATVPDGYLERTVLTRILDLDEKRDPSWTPSNSESVEVHGDTVWYKKVTYVAVENRIQWREESATIRLARTKAAPKHDPLNFTDTESNASMSLPTWLLLRQIEMTLRMKEREVRREYLCTSKGIPPAEGVRPHLMKKLARDNYVRFEDAYRAWDGMLEILQAANCGDKYARRGAKMEWNNFAEETLGLRMRRRPPDPPLGFHLEPASSKE